MLSTRAKIVSVLAPVADAFAGTVYSDAVNMKNFQMVTFAIQKGVGTTGTSTVTVEKCSAANGTGAEAIPFYSRRIQANETQGDVTRQAAAGFTTTAGSDEMYEIYVSQQVEGLAEGDKPWVRVKMVEVVDSPVLGAIFAILEGPRVDLDVAVLS